MADVFLTGGSGFIGGALLDRLASQGRRVVALARSDEAAAVVESRGAAAVVRGDLGDDADWADSLKGCATVFHVGGLNTMCRRNHAELERVNVAAAVSVVRAAATAGVERVVLTSSAAAIGERQGEVGTEKTTHSGEHLSAYAASKHRGERAALAEGQRLGMQVIAVNPSSVQGPGRVGGTARLIVGFLRGKLRWAVDADVSVVSIGDCVEGHLLAEAHGVCGERYLLSGWTASTSEMVEVLRGVSSARHRVRYVPGGLLGAIAGPIELLWRLRRRPPPLCREMVRTIRHGHRFDGSRASRDLGLEYTDPTIWLTETVAWYRQQHLI